MAIKFDDYVYKTTVRTCYEFSDLWMAELGPADKEKAVRRRDIRYLYYRPRIEAVIDAKRSAYEHMLSYRVQRFTDARGQAFDAAMTRAETAPIEFVPLPLDMLHLVDQIKSRGNVSWREKPCWIRDDLTPDDVWQYVYRLGSNYLGLTGSFYDVSGSGYCLLALRDRMPELVTRHLLDAYGRQWKSKVRRNWVKYLRICRELEEESTTRNEEDE